MIGEGVRCRRVCQADRAGRAQHWSVVRTRDIHRQRVRTAQAPVRRRHRETLARVRTPRVDRGRTRNVGILARAALDVERPVGSRLGHVVGDAADHRASSRRAPGNAVGWSRPLGVRRAQGACLIGEGIACRCVRQTDCAGRAEDWRGVAGPLNGRFDVGEALVA